jgi:hypothetical protein
LAKTGATVRPSKNPIPQNMYFTKSTAFRNLPGIDDKANPRN